MSLPTTLECSFGFGFDSKVLFQKLIKNAELFKKLSPNYFTSYDRNFVKFLGRHS
jgi:hypothetical protein